MFKEKKNNAFFKNKSRKWSVHALTELCMAVSFVSPVKLIYASLLTRVKYLISKKIIYVGQRRIAKKNDTTSQTVTGFFWAMYMFMCMKRNV